MSVYRWLGLDHLKIGAVNLSSAGAYMPTTMTTIQNILPDSARVMIELPDEERLFVEDSAEPDIVAATGEFSKFIEWATRDMDFTDVFVKAFGGSVASSVYSFPTSSTTIRERSIEAQTEAVNSYKFKIQIPRTSLRGRAELRLFKRNPDTGIIGFNAAVLQATTDGGTVVAPLKVTRVAG